ncbi:MAG: nickel pincer cofactor biosynthesis protein LarB [Nitrospinota bacterium]|nr:nickel pincer cofactor biosynthesis protein LarB [Nitrospinota bacterium]
MDKLKLKKLLESVKTGDVSISRAMESLEGESYEDILYAKVDHHREKRQGFCEVIYCPGKTSAQISGIAKKLLARSDHLLATRGDRKIYSSIKKISPKAKFHEASGAITVEKKKRERKGNLLVITAGTTDIPIAEEAVVTADIMGTAAKAIYDVGVAGIHRLLDQQEHLAKADCIIVVAGMDGALASVVGGMVAVPVIAVPSSVGYGASFGGLSALLAMLNSCASGVAVVNIDNGFGAGALAHKIVSQKYSGGERGK